METDDTEPAPTEGVRVDAVLSRVMDWSSRPDNRRRIFGPAGDLSANDLRLLNAVQADGPMRLSDLAARQGVDKSTITVQVRRLEQRGLLERRTSEVDRRASLLAVSAHGRVLQRQRAATGAAAIDTLLADWTEDERRTFAALFTRFAQQLESVGLPIKS